MSFKIVAQDEATGRDSLISIDDLSSANIVLLNVDCEASVYIGAAVVVNASGVARNALADSTANSNVLGIVQAKASSVLCDIRVLGVSSAVYSSLDVTKEYYLSDSVAGEITTTVPTASGSVKIKLGQPFSSTEFLMSKGERTIRA
jgi:hypothetical protein